jgi:hypothetical protein
LRARVIATLPPYVDHRREIIAHPRVDELRFNTISPLAEARHDMVARLQREAMGKRLWLDLKGRQLRITKFAYLPYAFVELSHTLTVDLPCDVYFRDCVSRAVELVAGNKLILNRRPVRVVGDGEPVNILDASLTIDGYLTESDKEYVIAARAHGLHDFMLSFAERPSDVADVRALDPDANVVAKIESKRGLAFAPFAAVRLMAARDDLYVQLGDDKTAYVPALAKIVKADPDAICASRIFESLEHGAVVSSQDIADVELMLRLGYSTFMLSDTLCFREESFRAAMAVLARLLPS